MKNLNEITDRLRDHARAKRARKTPPTVQEKLQAVADLDANPGYGYEIALEVGCYPAELYAWKRDEALLLAEERGETPRAKHSRRARKRETSSAADAQRAVGELQLTLADVQVELQAALDRLAQLERSAEAPQAAQAPKRAKRRTRKSTRSQSSKRKRASARR